MMDAIETTTNVRELLESSPAGTVHSVYERTVNLSFSGRLVALQTDGSPVSPISVILPARPDGMAAFAPGEGAECAAGPGAIRIGGKTIRIAPETRIFDPYLPPHSAPHAAAPEFAAAVRRIILRSGRSGFARLVTKDPASADDPVLRYASAAIDSAADRFRSGDPAGCAKELRRVIGLGQGLTPSGDDFICGVFAGMTAVYGEHPLLRPLRDEVAGHLGDTPDISAAFLRCALTGLFSKPVRQLFAAEDPEPLLPEFLAVGHSSGIDTLCGVLWLLSLPGRVGSN